MQSGTPYTQRINTRSYIVNKYLVQLAFAHIVHFCDENASETRPDGAVVEVEERQRNLLQVSSPVSQVVIQPRMPPRRRGAHTSS